MEKSDYLLVLAAFETALMAVIIGAVFTVGPSIVKRLYLYELIGAVAAATITTYGLYKMHDIT